MPKQSKNSGYGQMPYSPPYTEPRRPASSREVWRGAAGPRKGRSRRRGLAPVALFLCVAVVAVLAVWRLPKVFADEPAAEPGAGYTQTGGEARPAVQPFTGEPVTIVLDAGHGGIDTGSAGGGVNESELTRDMLNRLSALLQTDGRFIVEVTTEEGETQLSTEARGTVTAAVGAEFFLSLHFNEYRTSSVNGFTAYAQPPKHPHHEGSLRAANLMVQQVQSNTKLSLLGDTGIYYMFFGEGDSRTSSDHSWYIDEATLSLPTYGVLQHASCPGLLVEMWYLTSPSDMSLMNNEQGFDTMAACLYGMLCEYFGME